MPETVGTLLLHKIMLNINVELDQNSPESNLCCLFRWRYDRCGQKEGSGRASAASCTQKLCDPRAETAVQRRSRRDPGKTRLPDWTRQPWGAAQVILQTLEGWVKKQQFWIYIWVSFRCHFAIFIVGRITRSPWWSVSACPNVRRMPRKGERCPCPTSWAASRTLVISQRWQEGRWASGDVANLPIPGWFCPAPSLTARVVVVVAAWNFSTPEKEESHEEEHQKER